MADIVGWYGKLPTLGDFASRRLEPEFIEPWDHWLAEGIAALRRAQPDAWLDAYLQSPTWRFLLMPGAIPGAMGERALAGVLMPSVDRVGRYFPFTAVQALPALPQRPEQVDALLNALHELDDLAVDAMHDDWDIERLEAELAKLALPQVEAPPAASAPLAQVLAGHAERALVEHGGQADLVRLLSASAASSWQRAAHGLCFWLADAGEAAASPRLLVTRGLPGRETFTALLGSGEVSA